MVRHGTTHWVRGSLILFLPKQSYFTSTTLETNNLFSINTTYHNQNISFIIIGNPFFIRYSLLSSHHFSIAQYTSTCLATSTLIVSHCLSILESSTTWHFTILQNFHELTILNIFFLFFFTW